MKLFKYLPFLIIVFCLSVLAIDYKINNDKYRADPKSDKNKFITELDHALKTANLQTSNITLRDFQNEIEFYIIKNKEAVKVICSTQKDPYWQVASLQEIFNTAKIKGNNVKFVDLSIDHPYATFKNN
jgi:NADH:ubiquinone oxidoreductase subunit C